MVAEAGADWIGINFHPASKRFVPPDRAPGLVAEIAGRSEAVGLFVDRPPAEIVETAERAGLWIVQLHGDEPAESVRDLRRDGYRVVRAFRLGDRLAIDRMESWLLQASRVDGLPDAVLVDAFVPGQAGGTGHVLADEVLDALADRLRMVPFLARHDRAAEADPTAPKLILAGGLTPSNVARLVARVRPWMVDVASGVESSPGRKDPGLVAAFVRAVRSTIPGRIKRIVGLSIRFGGGPHRGWLPPGAATPPPTPTRDVLLDIEIVSDGHGYLLCFESQDGTISGDSWHKTLDGAERTALESFGARPTDWVAD